MYDKMRELCAMKMVLFHGHTDRHRKTKYQFSPSPAAIIPFGTSKADIGRKKKTHTTNDKMMNRIARIDGMKKKNTKSIAACHNSAYQNPLSISISNSCVWGGKRAYSACTPGCESSIHIRKIKCRSMWLEGKWVFSFLFHRRQSHGTAYCREPISMRTAAVCVRNIQIKAIHR